MPRFDAIYARQSVDKKDSVSIEAQIDDCKRLCSKNPRIYSDRGFSGKNVERPDMQKLIKDIQSGMIKKVVVYKVDRISRNLSDFCNLYDMSGLLKCAKCGSAIKMQARPTLTCNGRNQKKICDVSFKGIKFETIRENVAVQVQDYLDNLSELIKEKRRQRQKANNEIEKLQGRLKNLISLVGPDDEVSDELRQEIRDVTLQVREKMLEQKMDAVDDVISLRLGITDQNIFTGIFDKDGRVIFEYANLSDERKQTILRAIANKILVHSDGAVSIEWKEV